jgi:sirohydrochlorin ferrochelatase
MATVEERMKILKMVEEGKVSAADGAQLLAALSDSRRPPAPPAAVTGGARWFRVRVTDLKTGKTKVTVNIPMGLVDVGIKMGARFAPNLDSDQMAILSEALRSGQVGKLIEATDEEDGERVEIFVE